MQVFMVILKSLGMSFGICAIVLVVFMVFTMFWVRAAVRDKTYCYFLSGNRKLTGKLLKPGAEDTIEVGSGDDAPKYKTHSSKQFWSSWPPGLPRFLQEPVPTLFYVEGNVEPLDPYDRTSLITPESLRKISDSAMLKQMWKDVKESLGIKPAFGGNTLLIILVLVAVVASALAAYMSFTAASQTDMILKALGG